MTSPIRLVSLLMLMILSACAPTVMATGPMTAEAQLEEDSVLTTDGQRLPLRHWLPLGEVRAVVVALHGMNDYSNAFEGPGKALAEQGIAVFAYDQRGFGRAPNVGYWPGEETLAEDLSMVIRLISARYPGKRLFVLGESMGGAVAMVTLSRRDVPPVDGVILSAPAVWGRSNMNVFQRSLLFMASYTMPWLTLTGQGLHIQPSDNIEMLRALSRDPLVIKETRVDAVHGLCDLMDEAAASAPFLHRPTLVLYGEKDEVVPPEPIYAMMASLPDNPTPPVRAVYSHGYHMLMRDLQARVVLDDIAAWILHPDQPLPSGADRRARDVLTEMTPLAG